MKFKGKIPKLSLRLPRLKLLRFGFPRPRFSTVWVWRIALLVMILVCGGLVAEVWFSGTRDTESAMLGGRRLLVDLQSGAVQGKEITLDRGKRESQKNGPGGESKSTDKSADTATGETKTENGEAKTDATAENNAMSPLESAEPILPEDLAEASMVKPAEVPLAAVKPGLSEKTTNGLVPVVSADSEKSWQYYAKPYQRKDKRPVIAIIVSGLGESKTVTNAAIKLPENVTLSFDPYARESAIWVPAARTAGHEVMMDLPLEPSNYPASDPGPYGLLVAKGARENASRLQWLMARFQGYIGFVSPQNEVFTADDDSLTMLLQTVATRGLMIAIGREPAKTETQQLIESSQAPNIIIDSLIDEDLSAPAIQARLDALERKALKNGAAVGLAQSYPITIKQLETWLPQAEKNGVTLVPVSFITSIKAK